MVSRHDIAAVPGLVALGVSGCILKEDRADVLVSAITGIATGAAWFSPAVLVALARESPATKATLLTSREQEVMLLLAEGYRNSKIANTLGTPRHIIGDAGVYLRWQYNWQVREAGLALESRFALARRVIFLPR